MLQPGDQLQLRWLLHRRAVAAVPVTIAAALDLAFPAAATTNSTAGATTTATATAATAAAAVVDSLVPSRRISRCRPDDAASGGGRLHALGVRGDPPALRRGPHRSVDNVAGTITAGSVLIDVEICGRRCVRRGPQPRRSTRHLTLEDATNASGVSRVSGVTHRRCAASCKAAAAEVGAAAADCGGLQAADRGPIIGGVVAAAGTLVVPVLIALILCCVRKRSQPHVGGAVPVQQQQQRQGVCYGYKWYQAQVVGGEGGGGEGLHLPDLPDGDGRPGDGRAKRHHLASGWRLRRRCASIQTATGEDQPGLVVAAHAGAKRPGSQDDPRVARAQGAGAAADGGEPHQQDAGPSAAGAVPPMGMPTVSGAAYGVPQGMATTSHSDQGRDSRCRKAAVAYASGRIRKRHASPFKVDDFTEC